MQDPDSNYLLALPAQIEAVLERSTSARARRSAEAMLTRQHRLLQAISRAQAVFIASAKPEAAFDALLDELMELTAAALAWWAMYSTRPVAPHAALARHDGHPPG